MVTGGFPHPSQRTDGGGSDGRSPRIEAIPEEEDESSDAALAMQMDNFQLDGDDTLPHDDDAVS